MTCPASSTHQHDDGLTGRYDRANRVCIILRRQARKAHTRLSAYHYLCAAHYELGLSHDHVADHAAARRAAFVAEAQQYLAPKVQGRHGDDKHIVDDGAGVGVRSEERRVGKEVSVRVDLGGRRFLKKKKKKTK